MGEQIIALTHRERPYMSYLLTLFISSNFQLTKKKDMRNKSIKNILILLNKVIFLYSSVLINPLYLLPDLIADLTSSSVILLS
ncbi:hypothetical protein GCM10009409_38170 [Shewanella saliphila]|uniref:Uncharacterized protein n=1 Tax=Shewanella saliphila TaxID=2282698 RepID=A0ABQ2QD78_9GAMM|nr:hypothetical protein GCM10009409_38170 [Shewanella saliphila]